MKREKQEVLLTHFSHYNELQHQGGTCSGSAGVTAAVVWVTGRTNYCRIEARSRVWKTGLPQSSWKRLTADVCEIVTKEQQLEKNISVTWSTSQGMCFTRTQLNVS
ncbi:hypothetical protein DPX16_2834 [Anabarilius grahami]|uniref:Uncharacterized protein n=1 Tax=Anabarilius grahami TaxID=495550 RepID=A0A3N0YWE1_ANAGA|nr:hypothetical protein DPX16_2834 [Anabarilius grahami]